MTETTNFWGWIALTIATPTSWILLPEFSGTSLILSMMGCAVLIFTPKTEEQ